MVGHRVVGIIQARLGSSRLPGKVLAELGHRPLLGHVIQRTAAAKCVDTVVVATTDHPQDTPVAEFAAAEGVSVYRGSEQDVLDRYHGAAERSGADIVVRVTADDPFKDPMVIDSMVEPLLADLALDYVSNTIERTFPLGIDVEAMRYRALQRAWDESSQPYDREHVTPYIREHPDWFNIKNIRHDPDLSHLRWTIDYPEDLAFARAVYDRLGGSNVFHMGDVLQLLRDDPELGRFNERR